MIQPFEDLANAIILQAVKDYRSALKYSKNTQYPSATVRSIEKFFHSTWFSILSDIDPDYLISKLKKEVK